MNLATTLGLRELQAGGPGSGRHQSTQNYKWVMDPRNGKVAIGSEYYGVEHVDLMDDLGLYDAHGMHKVPYDKIPRGMLTVDHAAKKIINTPGYKPPYSDRDRHDTPAQVLEKFQRKFRGYKTRGTL